MATILQGPQDDPIVLALKAALDDYEQQHPGAEAKLYRYNPGSVRVRIVSDYFAGMNRSRRHDEVWDFLAARVGEDSMSEVSLLLLLPHAELQSSLMNLEFEDMTRSRL